MRVTWYNRPRQFDNGIVWVRLQRKRRLSFGAEGFGLWFSRWFPWVWPLTPWTTMPAWAHDRAVTKGSAATPTEPGGER